MVCEAISPQGLPQVFSRLSEFYFSNGGIKSTKYLREPLAKFQSDEKPYLKTRKTNVGFLLAKERSL